MRSFTRTPFRTPARATAWWQALGPEAGRDIALVCLADAVVGASFGAITVGAGLPAWLPILLSVAVFAGASQFIFVGIVGAGAAASGVGSGGVVAAVAAGLLVNARHLPFGFAVADLVRGGITRRLVGSHLMIDESVAFALAHDEGSRRRSAAYWACGISLFFCWNLSVVFGVLAGQVVGDTDAWGLDAAFPAVLLALVLPSLREARTRRAALAGGGIALATSFLLPAGLPVLLSLFGVATLLTRRRHRPRGDHGETADGSPTNQRSFHDQRGSGAEVP